MEPKKAVKSAYEKPQLEVFGDLSDLTETISGSGGRDGGSFPKKYTH